MATGWLADDGPPVDILLCRRIHGQGRVMGRMQMCYGLHGGKARA
jgi:hypothetical protein